MDYVNRHFSRSMAETGEEGDATGKSSNHHRGAQDAQFSMSSLVLELPCGCE